MAKRYELSDAAWEVVADLFTETRFDVSGRRGLPGRVGRLQSSISVL